MSFQSIGSRDCSRVLAVGPLAPLLDHRLVRLWGASKLAIRIRWCEPARNCKKQDLIRHQYFTIVLHRHTILHRCHTCILLALPSYCRSGIFVHHEQNSQSSSSKFCSSSSSVLRRSHKILAEENSARQRSSTRWPTCCLPPFMQRGVLEHLEHPPFRHLPL